MYAIDKYEVLMYPLINSLFKRLAYQTNKQKPKPCSERDCKIWDKIPKTMCNIGML